VVQADERLGHLFWAYINTYSDGCCFQFGEPGDPTAVIAMIVPIAYGREYIYEELAFTDRCWCMRLDAMSWDVLRSIRFWFGERLGIEWED
jgi:hypothetical protein